MGRFRSVGAAFQDASAVMVGVGFTSFWTDGSWNLWPVTLTFAGVLATATMLFDRLAGPTVGADFPMWIRNMLLAAIGAGLGSGQLWLAPVQGVRFGALMLFAVLFAWILAAWRQRWGERRVYRATLRQEPADPDTLEA